MSDELALANESLTLEDNIEPTQYSSQSAPSCSTHQEAVHHRFAQTTPQRKTGKGPGADSDQRRTGDLPFGFSTQAQKQQIKVSEQVSTQPSSKKHLNMYDLLVHEEELRQQTVMAVSAILFCKGYS